MKHIELPCFKIVVDIIAKSGSITSDLKVDSDEDGDDYYNSAMDGIESLILAHACAGINIETPEYIESIETAVNSCDNNF